MKPVRLCLLGLAIAGLSLFGACEKQPYSKIESLHTHAHHGDDHKDDKAHKEGADKNSHGETKKEAPAADQH